MEVNNYIRTISSDVIQASIYHPYTKSIQALTLLRQRPLSYRNHSIDLLLKSMNYFLYDNGLRLERVNQFQSFTCHLIFRVNPIADFYIIQMQPLADIS